MTPPPRPNTLRVVKEGAALGGARDHGFHRSRRPSAAGPPGDREPCAHPDGSQGSAVKRGSAGRSRSRGGLGFARSVECSCRVVGCRCWKDASFPLRAARRYHAGELEAARWKASRGDAGRSGGGRGSLPRRFSLTTRIDSRRVTRVRGERGRAVKGERVRVCSGRETGDRSSGRRPGHDGAVVSNRKAARSGSGATGLCGLLYSTQVEASVRSARPSPPSRDRGRQRSERPVRLPQPKGAGGQQPPKVVGAARSPQKNDGLHAAPGRNRPKLARSTAALPGGGSLQRELRSSPAGTRPRTKMPCRAKARRAEARPGREAGRGTAPTWASPAGK